MGRFIIKWRQVTFYGVEVLLVVDNDLQPYLPVNRLAQALGLSRQALQSRIGRDPVLREAVASLRPLPGEQVEGIRGTAQCLDLRRVPYLLGGIDHERVKPALREQVIRFKREFYEFAWAAYRNLILPEEFRAEFADRNLTPEEAEVYAALGTSVRRFFETVEKRISALEARLQPELDAAQAQHVQEMVRTLAKALDPQRAKQRETYALIYGALKKQFRVPSYRNIPAKRYEEVVRYLAEWYQRVVPGELPPLFRPRKGLW